MSLPFYFFFPPSWIVLHRYFDQLCFPLFRGKKALEERIREITETRSISEFYRSTGMAVTLLYELDLTIILASTAKGSANKPVCLIMDEVDGMSGTSDRGGLKEVIALIKSTKVPIICLGGQLSN